MGRCFGFAFGHKENGAVFSHMAVMYAYALYERKFARQAYKVLDQLYHQSTHFEVSRMYPGIPEYFNSRGRGAYTYLTGSASWYLLTMVTQAFGVRGLRGDLLLAPKLVSEQFDTAGNASLTTLFAGRLITIRYRNPSRLEPESYRIAAITLDGNAVDFEQFHDGAIIPRQVIADSQPGEHPDLVVHLAPLSG
jgi:cellobiose phosphorylase